MWYIGSGPCEGIPLKWQSETAYEVCRSLPVSIIFLHDVVYDVLSFYILTSEVDPDPHSSGFRGSGSRGLKLREKKQILTKKCFEIFS